MAVGVLERLAKGVGCVWDEITLGSDVRYAERLVGEIPDWVGKVDQSVLKQSAVDRAKILLGIHEKSMVLKVTYGLIAIAGIVLLGVGVAEYLK